MGMNLLCVFYLTNTIILSLSLYPWYTGDVDISAVIESLQDIQNETAAVQSSSPSHEEDDNVDHNDQDFVVSNAHESVLEEACVCVGDGLSKDTTRTPEEVYEDLQYPYG